MCGLAGFIDFTKNLDIKNLDIMTSKLRHRGPDNFNSLFEEHQNFNFGLGHTRLSIVDLSDNGNQPMKSLSGNKIIIFNGEIYNFREIKKRILEKKKLTFRGNSDTEIFIEAIEVLGLIETLNLVSGMFAFVLYDKKQKNIYLCRDRFGQKPLFYSMSEDSLIFASEIKSFIGSLESKEIDQNSIKDFFLYNYIKGSKTIFKNVKSINPGTLVKFDIENKKIIENNWKIKKNINFKKNILDLNNLDNLLTNSIQEQTNCEVPYGIFLSGGVDSSLIAAIAQKKLSKNIKTFTISFKNKNYSEGKFANKIAEYLKTDHNEYLFDNDEMINTINQFFELNDQPFADVSKLPLIMLSKFSSKKIKVALSGDGADEVFGGYNRYYWIKKLNAFSLNQRKIIKKLLQFLNLNTINKIFKFYNYLSTKNFISYPDEKIQRLSNIIGFENLDRYYELSQIKWHDKNPFIDFEISNNENFSCREKHEMQIDNFINKMMMTDQNDYLINNCLVKSDRSTMINSLELRLPFLNDQVVDFGNNLKLDKKISKQKGKLILRNLLSVYIPNKLFDRDKTGFHVPLGFLFKKELKETIEKTINNKKIKNLKFLDHGLINKIWQDHLSGKANNQNKIWTILVLQKWILKNYE